MPLSSAGSRWSVVGAARSRGQGWPEAAPQGLGHDPDEDGVTLGDRERGHPANARALASRACLGPPQAQHRQQPVTGIDELLALVNNRLKRMQHRPDLLDGFLGQT